MSTPTFSTHTTPNLWVRAAGLILATAITATACGQGSPTGIEEASGGPTVESSIANEQPHLDGSDLPPTVPVSPTPDPSTGSDADQDPGTPPDGDTADEESDGPIRTVDDVTAAAPIAEEVIVSGNPTGRPPASTGVIDLITTPAANGQLGLEMGISDEPITLVLEGRGTHVADLLAIVGDVAPGSTLTIDFGDGDAAQVGTVAPGQPVRVSHAYEPTLTFDNQLVIATLTEPDGTEHRDRLTFATRARFALYYSPITVRALNDCDTFGKGDFRLSWNNGDGDKQHDFKLGAGERARIGGFANPAGTIVYDEPVPFEIRLEEKDPYGAWFFAPWKWEMDFHGGSASNGDILPIRQIGDHTYTVNSVTDTEAGIPGDDDCATHAFFDITLDMLDD